VKLHVIASVLCEAISCLIEHSQSEEIASSQKARALLATTWLGYNYSMNKIKIKIPKAKIAEFCKRWNVSEFAVFGSALSADFRPDSDVDVLVSFDPQAKVTLFDMVHMQEELKVIFGREVDLVSKRGVMSSRNYLRRKNILESAQVIHVAR